MHLCTLACFHHEVCAEYYGIPHGLENDPSLLRLYPTGSVCPTLYSVVGNKGNGLLSITGH